MNLWLAAGSLAGVLLIAFAAWRMRLGGDPRIDAAEAHALATADGLAVAELIIDRAGFAALAHDSAGRFVLLRQHGAHFVAQRLRQPLDARLDHRFLTIGRARKGVTLDLGEAAGIWAAKLRTLRT